MARRQDRVSGLRPHPAVLLAAACAAAAAAGALVASVTDPAKGPAQPSYEHLVAAPAPAPTAAPAPRAVAEQLITVTAASTTATRAQVQRWERRDGRWVAVSGRVMAQVGADGLTTRPVEGRAATPLGLFTLTDTFGIGPNQGGSVTHMRYRTLRYGDSWGSDPTKPTYNRLWNCHCAGGELYVMRGTFFRYGIVMDVNRRPVVPGAGSGFFVHVTDGHPTDGCVALDARWLAATLRWLEPAGHPRIEVRIGAPGMAPAVPPV